MAYNSKFSLDTFKKWMSENHEETQSMDKPKSDGLVGLQVESKVGMNRLVNQMKTEGSNLEELALDFRENGGQIIEVEGKEFTVEVNSGCFTINRAYVKKA